ncbi:MAG: hypothetical protein QM706_05375 [Nitrospira sp.]
MNKQVWESEQSFDRGRICTSSGRRPHLARPKVSFADEYGRPYALSEIALDITPRLKLEAAIQASEDTLQSAQSAANIGVFDWDLAAHNGVWFPEFERIWGLPVGASTAQRTRGVGLFIRTIEDRLTQGTQRSLSNPMTASEFEYRIRPPRRGHAMDLCQSEDTVRFGRPSDADGRSQSRHHGAEGSAVAP